MEDIGQVDLKTKSTLIVPHPGLALTSSEDARSRNGNMKTKLMVIFT